jgi:hypothetical protein
MAIECIEDVWIDYLKNNSVMGSEFNGVSYLLNDNEFLPPYTITYLIDDPGRDTESATLCEIEQGAARFQCEVYTETALEGLSKRKKLIGIARGIEGTITDGYNVWKVSVVNINDRPAKIDGLYSFVFETILSWELDT